MERENQEPDAGTPSIDDITLIDLEFLGVPGVIAAYLIDCGGDLALVETGPTTTLPTLERALDGIGVSLADIGVVMVSHIHLDHSGAAGMMVRANPRTRVLVHPAGAPHLIEPERLVRSAARIYGDEMDRLWGEIAGVPAAQLEAFEDGQRLTVGNRTFQIAFTTGHASHHVVMLDERTGTLFTGDTGGVRASGTSWVAAPIPPPEFDPDGWRVSLTTMRAMRPVRLALTHFGFHDEVEWHVDQIEPRLEQLVSLGADAGDQIDDLDEMSRRIDAFQRAGLGVEGTDDVIRRLNLANPDLLAAMGLQRYLRKRREKSGS